MPASDAASLLKAAVKAAKKAHAPYSKFHVGAALVANDGTVFTGCNVENASYGLTICAERNAVFAAVAAGKKKFRAVAIVALPLRRLPSGPGRVLRSGDKDFYRADPRLEKLRANDAGRAVAEKFYVLAFPGGS